MKNQTSREPMIEPGKFEAYASILFASRNYLLSAVFTLGALYPLISVPNIIPTPMGALFMFFVGMGILMNLIFLPTIPKKFETYREISRIRLDSPELYKHLISR